MWMGLITMTAFVTIALAIGRAVWSSSRSTPSPYELDSDDNPSV
jgi:hypothetical protein